MIRGLLIKTIREVWLMILLMAISLMLIMALLTYIIPHVQQSMNAVFEQMPFVKPLIEALLGSDVGEEINARTMQAIVWVHPTVLALVWTTEVILCTRVPVGEIDRGTIDMLLGLPVSRRMLYLSETIVWLFSGALIMSMGLLGHLIMAPALGDEMRHSITNVIQVIVNFFCVYIAVGGIGFFVSSLSERRGRAMATIFGIVLASFLLNFVAQFWQAARAIRFLECDELLPTGASSKQRNIADRQYHSPRGHRCRGVVHWR